MGGESNEIHRIVRRVCGLGTCAVCSAQVDILTTNLHAEYFLSTSGNNSQGLLSPIPGTVSFNAKDDALFAGVGDQFSDHNDIASVTLGATALATHKDKKKLLAVSVQGNLTATRPAYNHVDFPQTTGNLQGNGSALAEYNDVVIFKGTSLGAMHVQGFVRVPGLLKSGASRTGTLINAAASASVALSGTGMPLINKTDYINLGFDESHPDVDIVNEFSYDVSPLQPRQINFRLEVHGNALYGGSANPEQFPATASVSFSADFARTLEWGGITSVTDLATGLPVTDWTVTSESGFDYTQFFAEVPEPSTAVLFALGCSVVIVRRVWR